MAAVRGVVETQGVFCALYSDRASHFFVTPKAGGKVDHHRLTQVGRALQELEIKMIPAYSPQARGRSERSFGTWQGRLPQELRGRGIETVSAANAFLRETYINEFNQRFTVAAEQKGSAFVRCRRRDLDLVFSLQQERTVNRDNTVSYENRICRSERAVGRTPWPAARWWCMNGWTGASSSVTVPMRWPDLKWVRVFLRGRPGKEKPDHRLP